MPGIFSFGERKSSLTAALPDPTTASSSSAAKKAKKQMQPKTLSAAIAAAGALPSTPPQASKRHSSNSNSSSGSNSSGDSPQRRRRRARPTLDPIALAAVSSQKLQQERQRGSCNMHKMVLVQNLLNAVYASWSSLLEKPTAPPAPTAVTAEVFDFEESADLENPVDELLQGKLERELVPDRKSGRPQRRGALLAWRHKGSDSAVDLTAALKFHLEAQDDEDDGDLSYSSESEDEEDQITKKVPKSVTANVASLKPGRNLRRVKSDSLMALNNNEADDEVPLGHLAFARDAILPSATSVVSSSTKSVASLSPVASKPIAKLPILDPPPPPRASSRKHSPLRHAASLDSLKAAAAAQDAPSLQPSRLSSNKPAMTLIEQMEQRERAAKATGTAEDRPTFAEERPTSLLAEPPCSKASFHAPAELPPSPTPSSVSSGSSSSASSSLLKKSLEMVRSGRKSTESKSQQRQPEKVVDVSPAPEITTPIKDQRRAGEVDIPGTVVPVAPAMSISLHERQAHLQPQNVKKKSSLLNLKSVFGRRRGPATAAVPQPIPNTPAVRHSEASAQQQQQKQKIAPAAESPSNRKLKAPTPPPSQPPKARPSQKSPPPTATSPAPQRQQPAFKLRVLDTKRQQRPQPSLRSLEPPPMSFFSAVAAASPTSPTSTRLSTPKSSPTALHLDLDVGSFDLGSSFSNDVLDGLAASTSVRRSFLLDMPTSYRFDKSPQEQQQQAQQPQQHQQNPFTLETSFCEMAFDFSWDLKL
ncbi:hypothetical protein DFJ77DRAFT_509083 [Powellomyces hirtus]|nr:hypothetical protein DFJ77DRAFT_509083 [Powellomyces hirtus]